MRCARLALLRPCLSTVDAAKPPSRRTGHDCAPATPTSYSRLAPRTVSFFIHPYGTETVVGDCAKVTGAALWTWTRVYNLPHVDVGKFDDNFFGYVAARGYSAVPG